MIGQPLTHAELEQVYGVNPSITGRLRHMLQCDSFADHPDLLRGVLALHSKRGLGLDLHRAYTTYFLLLGVWPGSARLLTQPRFVEPTITYGQTLIRAGLLQDAAAQIVPAVMPSDLAQGSGFMGGREPLGGMMATPSPAERTGPEGSTAAVSESPFEVWSESPGALPATPSFPGMGSSGLSPAGGGAGWMSVDTSTEDLPGSSAADLALERMRPVAGVMDLSPAVAASGVEDLTTAVPSIGSEADARPQIPEISGGSSVEMTTEAHADVRVIEADRRGEQGQSHAPEDTAPAFEIASQVSEVHPELKAEALPESQQAGSLSDVDGVLPGSAITAARQGLEERSLPFEQLRSDVSAGADAQSDEPSVATPDPELPALEPSVEVMKEQADEMPQEVMTEDRFSPELSLAEVNPAEAEGRAVTEETSWAPDVLSGLEKVGEKRTMVDLEGMTVAQEGSSGEPGNGGEAEWRAGSARQEAGAQRTLVFHTQAAVSVESPIREPQGLTAEPALSRMAEQLGGAFQKMPFSVAGVPGLEFPEGHHGPGEVAEGGSFTGDVGVSRLPQWEVEDRQAHPAEVSGYAQTFPDLEGLTAAVEAMQPHFTFLGELDAYYLQYPEQKGKRSLDDVRVIGDATRSLLDSLGLLSAPDADLFAPKFEEPDGALVRLLGSC